MVRHRESKRNFVNQPRKTPACLACLRNWTIRPYMYTDDEAAIERFENDLFLPDQFVLEVTSRCNAQCMTCIHNWMDNDLSSVRSGTTGFLDLEYLAEWLEPAYSNMRRMRMYNYGEPFLHKGLERFCGFLKSKNQDVMIGISSNGTSFGSDKRIAAILESGIDAVIVSLHGGTSEISRRYMGEKFPFDKALDNIGRLMAAKRQQNIQLPVVDLKCVLFEWNDSEKDITRFAELADELDVDAYHFVPTGGKIGTKRLAPGSDAWKAFEAAGKAAVNRRVGDIPNDYARTLVEKDDL
jgi:MoaA/NifB/PqqE/SkfB family radical SAM enzyme